MLNLGFQAKDSNIIGLWQALLESIILTRISDSDTAVLRIML